MWRDALKVWFLVLLGSVILVLTSTYINVSGYGGGHPDACQSSCHGNQNTVNDLGNQFWDHQIASGQNVWSYCTTCHQNYVAGSPHEGIGCKCHSVVHIGYNNTGTWAAWIFAYEPSPNNVPAMTGGGNTFVLKKLVYTNANATADFINFVKSIGTQEGMEIEVGVWNAWTNQFLSVGSANTWQLCFNCHFLASDPSQVGAYRMENGVWKIGIPEYTLKLDPHKIPSEVGWEPSGEDNGVPLPLSILGLIVSLGAAIFILMRRGI